MESYRTLPKDLQQPRNLSVGFSHGSRKAFTVIKNLPPHDLPEGLFPCQTDIFAYQPPKLNFGWVTTGASTCRVLACPHSERRSQTLRIRQREPNPPITEPSIHAPSRPAVGEKHPVAGKPGNKNRNTWQLT
ncbi:hypothetical protein ARMSODRAFT_134217 [Armillaria solidipes]|uniref:Uncharacterized protein n=1 Tax=Armillaria solidipes TaxID=1076256 RepID=A0A2H3AKX3_9AGAR|nr:hypothetical protein ARMSODRAFT_134217 [Armillaria solidipes]